MSHAAELIAYQGQNLLWNLAVRRHVVSEPLSHGDSRAGWKLDKYKFLHMVEETFEERPNAKWYVFIETDSYLFYPALATFLSRLDSSKPYYIGSAVSMGGIDFAHGGSGYVLSNAAMNRLLGPEMKEGVAAKWDAKMKGHCCGDVALGEALKEKGVEITVAHPLLNGYKPATFTYGPGQHWCQPVVSMHHVLPAEVSAVWQFERRREMLVEGANVRTFLPSKVMVRKVRTDRENRRLSLRNCIIILWSRIWGI